MLRPLTKPPGQKRGDAGFSMVEALVALGVFAMAGVGLVQLQTHSLQVFAEVERRAIGDMLAQNRLVEIAAANLGPDLGEQTGEVTYAGRDWTWRTEIAATSDPTTLRARVLVHDKADGLAAGDMTAFIAAPGAATP